MNSLSTTKILNKLLLLSLFAFFITIVHAQEETSQKIKKFVFMPQGGVNFSKFVDEPQSDDLRFRTGYQIGFYVRNNSNVYVQPGVFYSRQGNQMIGIDEISSETIQGNVDFNMVRVPVYFGMKILNIRIYSGPSFSFLTKIQDNPFGLDIDDCRKAIVGLNIGGGFNIWIFSFDVNYEFGLTRLTHVNSRANILSFNLGLNLKL
ncbi:MAG TPA: outer membrane beta-barrel protein [Bacteroidales bacterium]|jgi:hypothetical protein|nr:outer membrane beta-barrel protein [Bacteroidales bacterium]HXK81985.1 outer membrane beta-barrel protein [Bacteroidales bacterium]